MLSRNEIKQIKALKLKKYRNRERKFLVEGIKNVTEVLHSDFKVHHLFVTEKIKDEFKNHNPSIITEKNLNEISNFKNNTTCVAVVEFQSVGSVQSLNSSEHIIYLDNVSDPGNLGTIIRTMDWFSLRQLVCSPDCAEFYNPKTISSTMGSFTRIQPIYLEFNEVKSIHSQKYGLALGGTEISTVSKKPATWILGSESHGISEEISSSLTNKLIIPGKGQAESLNVGIAAGILCYELAL